MNVGSMLSAKKSRMLEAWCPQSGKGIPQPTTTEETECRHVRAILRKRLCTAYYMCFTRPDHPDGSYRIAPAEDTALGGGFKKTCPYLRRGSYGLSELPNHPTSLKQPKQPRRLMTMLTQIQAPEARCRSLSPPPSRTPFATMSRRHGKSDATLEVVEVHMSARHPKRGNGQKIVDGIHRWPAHTHPLWPPARDRHRSTCSRSCSAGRVRVGMKLCRSRSSTTWCGRALTSNNFNSVKDKLQGKECMLVKESV